MAQPQWYVARLLFHLRSDETNLCLFIRWLHYEGVVADDARLIVILNSVYQ